LTDNRNRTAGEIRKIFERGGGNMGSAGCVAYLFDRKGRFIVAARGVDEDALMGVALDAGADDMSRQGDHFMIVCDPASFNKVQEALAANHIPTTTAEITQLPKTEVGTDLEHALKVVRLLEALDDHDDAQNVYSNLAMSDELLAELSKE
jgi:transcriptional/translational regulatory protein YebC/TACO1